jgi:hypothetical protein
VEADLEAFWIFPANGSEWEIHNDIYWFKGLDGPEKQFERDDENINSH